VLPRGVNLPWLQYGSDFGANRWHPQGGLSTRRLDALHGCLAAARRAGAEVVRWFVLCDGRAGLDYDEFGVPSRLQPVVLDDMEAALSALHAHDLRMVPVLLDFTWGRPRRLVNGVPIGGRAHVLRDPVARHRLWRALDALLIGFGRDGRIAMWDAWNEPEWLSAAWRRPIDRLSRRLVRRCLAELVLHVRWHATQPVTVGLASARAVPLCRGLELDALQVHWYDHLERRAPLATLPHAHAVDVPVILGEFPTRGSARTVHQIVETARATGYAAAWPWSLCADDGASGASSALRALEATRTHFA
jgi:hypothetical protein